MTETPNEPPPPCDPDAGEICVDDIIGDIDVCDFIPEACVGQVLWTREICVTRTLTGPDFTITDISCTTISADPIRIIDPDNPPPVLSGLGPRVDLMSPLDGEVVSGTLTVEGSTASPNGVYNVVAWVDGQVVDSFVTQLPASSSGCTHPQGNDPGCPYIGFRASIDTTQLANGTHELVLVATDERNYPLLTAMKRTFSVDNGCTDTTAPIVTPITPAPGSLVAGQVPIEVAVDEDSDVDRMRIFVDGQMLALLHQPPWRTTWDASGAAPGSTNEILVRALDGCNNVEPLRWTVEIHQEPPPDPCTSDATPPSLTFTSPSPGTSTSGPVALAATASDANGVARVDFHVDGVLLQSDTSVPYTTTWDPSTSPSGSYVLEARATDTCGNTTSRFVTVSVAPSPIGWLDTPRHNQVLSGLAAPIAGWALGDGGLDSLWMSIDGQLPLTHIGSFSRGAHRPGACTTYPYIVDPDCPQVGITGSFDTTRLTNGVHTLRMSMTANNGLSNVFTRTFRVDNPAPRGWVHVPGHNQTLAGTGVIVYGWALGAGGLDNLSVSIDGTLIAVTFHLAWAGACAANPDMPDPDCPLVGWSGTLDTTTFTNGPHTMTLTGRDASGRWLSFERSFVIENL